MRASASITPPSSLAFARNWKNAMPFIPVPETVMVEVRMRLNLQSIEQTLYFQKGGGWDSASATTLANDILLWWTTYYRVEISDDVTLVEIVVTDLDVVDSFQVTVPAPSPAPTGSNGDGAAPNNVAICISFRTDRRGRSYRGRNYVSGIPTNLILNSVVLPDFTDAILSAYQTLPFATTSSGGTWVIASRRNGGVARVIGVTTPVTSVVLVDSVVDSQRRRLPGRGT